MEINIAFALSQNGLFEKKHFGDADKFQIYHLSNKEFMLRLEQDNPHTDYSPETGSPRQGILVPGNSGTIEIMKKALRTEFGGLFLVAGIGEISNFVLVKDLAKVIDYPSDLDKNQS